MCLLSAGIIFFCHHCCNVHHRLLVKKDERILGEEMVGQEIAVLISQEMDVDERILVKKDERILGESFTIIVFAFTINQHSP